MKSLTKISIVLPFFYDGGVERAMLNLATGLLARNITVDFVFISDANGPLTQQIPAGCGVVSLHKRNALSAIRSYIHYLVQADPDAVIAALTPANILAVIGKVLTRHRARVIVEVQISIGRTPDTSRLKAWLRPKFYRFFYRRADTIIAASHGIARELEAIGFAPEKIAVIHNPVVPLDITARMNEEIDHPWFGQSTPIVIAAGRLHPQKDFASLLRAFSIVSKKHRARLVIIGEGAERTVLESLARELGISDNTALVGFVRNPYAYLHRAKVFVLSSAWEGFGNVVAEALAVGTPVVSTDCPWGPREILQGGAYGTLVPVGDFGALAEAIEKALVEPSDSATLEKGAQPFTIPVVTKRYIDTILRI